MLNLDRPPSTRMLYYEDAYTKEFDSNVIRVFETENHETGVILNKTVFYPGGGGQPPDTGLIESSTIQAKVIKLQRRDEIIIHFLNKGFEEIKEEDPAR